MGNPTENRIDTVIATADVNSINTGITQINTAFDPYAVGLTEPERNNLFSLAEENEAFANDALAQGLLLSSQLPAAIQQMITNLQTDTILHGQLDVMENTQVLPLLKKVQDTKRLAAHERYLVSLAIYKIIEAFAKMGIPGFQASYDILKVRFENQGGNAPQQNP
jgi:hypothetical protein